MEQQRNMEIAKQAGLIGPDGRPKCRGHDEQQKKWEWLMVIGLLNPKVLEWLTQEWFTYACKKWPISSHVERIKEDGVGLHSHAMTGVTMYMQRAEVLGLENP